MTVSQENSHEHQRSYDVKFLPQNFRDAITMTRDLGLQYLWIDALCINQSSIEDWEEEVSD